MVWLAMRRRLVRPIGSVANPPTLPVLSRPASRMPLGPHYRCADQDDAAASHSGTADSLGCGRRDVRFIKPPDRPLRRRQGGDASCVGDRPARFAELDF